MRWNFRSEVEGFSVSDYLRDLSLSCGILCGWERVRQREQRVDANSYGLLAFDIQY